MPIGEFQYSVDDKGRVIIPPSFRDFVADGMVVTRGLDGCVYVYPLGIWSDIDKQLRSQSIYDPKARNFNRFFYSGASKVTLDSAGRVTLPQTLRSYAGISDADNSVLIAGTPNHLEIWNEARWNANLEAMQADLLVPESLMERIG